MKKNVVEKILYVPIFFVLLNIAVFPFKIQKDCTLYRPDSFDFSFLFYFIRNHRLCDEASVSRDTSRRILAAWIFMHSGGNIVNRCPNHREFTLRRWSRMLSVFFGSLISSSGFWTVCERARAHAQGGSDKFFIRRTCESPRTYFPWGFPRFLLRRAYRRTI